jgi:hypothetical protein
VTRTAFPFLLSILLLLAGCGAGNHYDMPAAKVRETLRSSEFLLSIFGSEVTDAQVGQIGTDTVVWTLIAGDDDRAMLRLTAKITPDRSGSRVSVDVLPPESTFKARVAQGLKDNPSIVNFYRAAVAEHVDAALTHRDFDVTRIYPEMLLATFANVPKLNKQFDEAAAQGRKDDADRAAHDPYESINEANSKALPGQYGAPDTSRKYGDPLDDTTPYQPN